MLYQSENNSTENKSYKVSIEQTWLPVFSGILCGILIVLIVVVGIKLCYERRYHVYRNVKKISDDR